MELGRAPHRRDVVGLAGLALLSGAGASPTEDRLAANTAALERLLDTSARRPPLDVMHIATGIAGELEALLGERLSHRQHKRVGAALANVNVQRADTAHKLDRPLDARILARRARRQAHLAGNDEIEGLAHRVSAIIEYHEGNATEALRFARAGRVIVPYGPVGAALAAEEARAMSLSGIPDPAVLETAVSESLRLANALPAGDRAIARFGLNYNPYEAHYVGALAHLRAGDAGAAAAHLAEARPTFDALRLRHFCAGLRIEQAHRLLRTEPADLDQACDLARASMEIFGTWRSRRMADRLSAFTRSLGPLRGSQTARDTQDAIGNWLRTPVRRANPAT
jgi:hypothetical protein